jgi:NCS1 family nucleobase:cation symporter-1
VDALYDAGGEYAYKKGWNINALIARALGVAPNISGFLQAIGVLDAVPDVFIGLYTNA